MLCPRRSSFLDRMECHIQEGAGTRTSTTTEHIRHRLGQATPNPHLSRGTRRRQVFSLASVRRTQSRSLCQRPVFRYHTGMQSPNAAANGTGPRAPATSRYVVWTMGLALVLATSFVTFAPSTLSPEVLRASLARLVRPTSVPGASGAGLSLNRRIGLVAGQRGASAAR